MGNISQSSKRRAGKEFDAYFNYEQKMKIPYQIRIEPEQLEALKQTAKNNGTSVNHEIRQAVRKHLKNA